MSNLRHSSIPLDLILAGPTSMDHVLMHWRPSVIICRSVILMVWLKVTYRLLYLIIIISVFHNLYIKFNYKTLSPLIYYLNKINSPI
jgi:hypothetical protein